MLLHLNWEDLSQSLKKKKSILSPSSHHSLFSLFSRVLSISAELCCSLATTVAVVSASWQYQTPLFSPNLSDYADKTFCLCCWALHLSRQMKDCVVFFHCTLSPFLINFRFTLFNPLFHSLFMYLSALGPEDQTYLSNQSQNKLKHSSRWVNMKMHRFKCEFGERLYWHNTIILTYILQ